MPHALIERVEKAIGPLTADVVVLVPDYLNTDIEHRLESYARGWNPLTWLGDMLFMIHFKEWL